MNPEEIRLRQLLSDFFIQNRREPTQAELNQMREAAGLSDGGGLLSTGADIGVQAGVGAVESGLTTARGIASLGAAIPGSGPIDSLLRGTANVLGDVREKLPEPTTGFGRASRTVGRIGTDIATMALPGGGLRAVATAGTKGALVAAAKGAPLAAAIGAGDPEASSVAAMARFFPNIDALQTLSSTPLKAGVSEAVFDTMIGFSALRVIPGLFNTVRTDPLEVGRSLKRSFDVGRASMTAQPATAVRNAVVGGARTFIEILDEGIGEGIAEVSKGKLPKEMVGNIWQGMAAMMRGFTKEGRAQMRMLMGSGDQVREVQAAITKLAKEGVETPTAAQIMETIAEGGKFEGRLSESLLKKVQVTPAIGAVGEGLEASKIKFIRGYVNSIQVFNRFQENIIRWGAGSARAAGIMRKMGIKNVDEYNRLLQATADPEIMSRMTAAAQGGDKTAAQFLKDAKTATDGIGDIARHALDVTFAQSKKDFGKVGQGFLKAFESFPPFLLAHPFPRFLAASTKFMYERSPLWLMMPKNRKIMGQLSKGGREAALAAGKLSEGFGLVAAGIALRESPLAGPKWYQMKTPFEDEQGNTKMLDLRAFAPLSTGIFVAEAVRQAMGEESQLEPKDLLEVVAGIKRISNTGLGAMLGIAESTSAQEAEKLLTGFTQDLISMYTTPGRALKDILQVALPEEGELLDKTVEADFGSLGKAPVALSKAIADVPFLGTATLPAAHVSTRAEPLGSDQFGGQGLVRQTFGATMAAKTPLESEMGRLGLNPNTSTGVGLLDRETNKLMGLYIAQSGVDEYIDSDKYVTLGDFNRRTAIQNFMGGVRAQAKTAALQQNQDAIVQEIVSELSQLKDINQVQRKLAGLEIPQEWKEALLPIIEQEMTPKSVIGSPIPALAGLEGPSFNFVSRHLPMRLGSMPQGAQ